MDSNPLFVALITFLVTNLWNYLDGKNKQQEKEKHQLNCLKKAFKTELQTLVSIYYERKVSSTPPKNGDEIHIVSLKSDYTTVYSKNCDKIGMLDEDTAEVVVIAYTHLSALMDTLRVYSKRWESKIHNERYGSKEWQYIYDIDVKNCHSIAYKEQEVTLKAINDAIEKLSK